MKHIYCLYAILWTFLQDIGSSYSIYVNEYLLGKKYPAHVEVAASAIMLFIWVVPFILMLKKGLKE